VRERSKSRRGQLRHKESRCRGKFHTRIVTIFPTRPSSRVKIQKQSTPSVRSERSHSVPSSRLLRMQAWKDALGVWSRSLEIRDWMGIVRVLGVSSSVPQQLPDKPVGIRFGPTAAGSAPTVSSLPLDSDNGRVPTALRRVSGCRAIGMVSLACPSLMSLFPPTLELFPSGSAHF
jgi:hypothetical protein